VNMRGKFESFGAAIDRCESPIERRFLIALLFRDAYSFEPVDGPPAIARDASGVVLSMQIPVEGRRIDFALTRRGAAARLAIELDGFAYHGATPEQFARDKARERELVGLGWTFLRFSGREVNEDPSKCAAEAMARAAHLLAGARRPRLAPSPRDARAPASPPGQEARRSIVGALIDFPELASRPETAEALAMLDNEALELVGGPFIYDYFHRESWGTETYRRGERRLHPAHECADDALATIVANVKILQDARVARETSEIVREQAALGPDDPRQWDLARRADALVRERQGLLPR